MPQKRQFPQIWQISGALDTLYVKHTKRRKTPQNGQRNDFHISKFFATFIYPQLPAARETTTVPEIQHLKH